MRRTKQCKQQSKEGETYSERWMPGKRNKKEI
jgi:hypothetical protein